MSSANKKVTPTRVGIIGGGVGGISAARVFLQEREKRGAENFEVSLFEKTGTLGGVWSDNYSGFGIQVPGPLYEFPDMPLDFANSDFAAGKKIHQYILRYADKHGISQIARLNCDVVSIVNEKQDGSCGKWRVVVKDNSNKTEDNTEETHFFDYVIVATGVYSSTDKFIPKYKNAEKFADQSEYFHSVDFKDDKLKSCGGKNVVTVGYGKSAFDCAMFAAENGAKSSTLLFREAHWPVPRKIVGLVPFEWATFSRFGGGVLKPMYEKPGPVESFVHKLPGDPLKQFWTLVQTIFARQFGFHISPQCMPQWDFITDFWGGHGVLPHPNFFEMVHGGKINAMRGEIKEVKANSVVVGTPGSKAEKDSTQTLEADMVIFGTGFKQNLNFLPQELRQFEEHDGLWLYRQLLHPEYPTLAFVNSQTTTFTNITTPALQARWLAEAAWKLSSDEDKTKLTKKAMYADIDAKKQWKRANMPNAGRCRSYMMQTHQVHYFDELLKDMGISIRRKTDRIPGLAALKEFFEPYRPRDYRAIVTGEFANEKRRFAAGEEQPSFLRELLIVFQCIVVAYFACYFITMCGGVSSDAWVLLSVVGAGALQKRVFDTKDEAAAKKE